MRCRWASIVLTDRNSRAATSLLDRPAAASVATCSSCGVSSSTALPGPRARSVSPLARSSLSVRSIQGSQRMRSKRASAARSWARACTRRPARRSRSPWQRRLRASSSGTPSRANAAADRSSGASNASSAAAIPRARSKPARAHAWWACGASCVERRGGQRRPPGAHVAPRPGRRRRSRARSWPDRRRGLWSPASSMAVSPSPRASAEVPSTQPGPSVPLNQSGSLNCRALSTRRAVSASSPRIAARWPSSSRLHAMTCGCSVSSPARTVSVHVVPAASSSPSAH